MKYHIEVTTKSTIMPDIYHIDHPDPESLNDAIIQSMMECGDIPFTGGMPEEYEGVFELKVTDEAGNVVYETEDPSDHFIHQRDCDFDDELDEVYEAYNEEHNLDVYEPGYYAVVFNAEKWNTCNYEVECDEFNPDLLCYVPMAGFGCMGSDSWFDPYHLTYNKQYLEHDDDEYAEDFYGADSIVLFKKDEYGWHDIRELDVD